MPKAITELPVGEKVKDPNSMYYGQPITFEVLDFSHAGYPADSVTLLSEKTIMLKSFDAKEPSNPNADRQNYGNNRYLHSNIRQWLNKDASPWYQNQHAYDEPPNSSYASDNPYENEVGFLSNLSADMKAKLLNTTLTVAKNTVTDGGGSEQVTDQVFLLSETEVGLGNENGIAEGTPFNVFSSGATRQTYPTQEAVDNSTYTSTPLNVNEPWYWWLRTPFVDHSRSARIVYSSGTLSYSSAYSGYYGVRPALNLKSDILVSDVPDGEGVYTISYNSAPQISGADQDLGAFASALQKTYSVTDGEGDSFSIIEKINGEEIQTINPATGGINYVYDLTSQWGTLPLGSHTATIIATDSKGLGSTRTWTFKKTNSTAESPTIVTPINGMRTTEAPEFHFIIGTDPEGNSQKFKIQIADNQGMTENLEEITTGFEVYENGDWYPIESATNVDDRKELRLAYTGALAKNTKKYYRVASIDSGSNSPSYSSVQEIKIGNVLDEHSLPFNVDSMPERISVTFKANIDPKATAQVLVCNNALDAEPTWEDMTTEYLDKKQYRFTNQTKTAADWAISIRFVVSANDAIGEISVSANGGGLS